MGRKIRSDIKVGNLEKKLGVPPGTFRNPDGRDTRSDKKLGTLRKEAEKTKQKCGRHRGEAGFQGNRNSF